MQDKPTSKLMVKKERDTLAVYGYVRVSTRGQVPGTSLDEQEQQILERYPAVIIVQEAASGAHERQQFDALCASLSLIHI